MRTSGDIKRGKVIAFGDQAVRLESKLREWSIPRKFVERVVEVGKPTEFGGEVGPLSDSPLEEGTVRGELMDGSVLILKQLFLRIKTAD